MGVSVVQATIPEQSIRDSEPGEPVDVALRTKLKSEKIVQVLNVWIGA